MIAVFTEMFILRSGKTYLSGTKTMANILSNQYKSVFSTPKNMQTYDYDFKATPITDILDINITEEGLISA